MLQAFDRMPILILPRTTSSPEWLRVISIHLSLHNDGYILDTLDNSSLETISRTHELGRRFGSDTMVELTTNTEVAHAQLTVFLR